MNNPPLDIRRFKATYSAFSDKPVVTRITDEEWKRDILDSDTKMKVKQFAGQL